MCGIVGVIDFADGGGLKEGLSPADLIKGMLGLIEHRGPDEMGYVAFGRSIIGSARLSIVDLASGSQPISTADDRFWIVYNGEVYDHDRIRQQLISQGAEFKTRSDTELVLQLIAARGQDAIPDLNGEFAFCVADRKTNEFTLVRDYWGTKPLYFAQPSVSQLVFSSEIKPLLWASRNGFQGLDPAAFAQTLVGWASVPPLTSFKGIQQLPPGTAMKISRTESGNIKIESQKWQPRTFGSEQPESLRELLADSVRRRLVADVPVGSYLSGGLDSTIVTALAAREAGKGLQTFSVEFEQAAFDESVYQKAVSRQLGTKHHSVRVGYNDLADNFVPAVIAAESMVFRSAFIPMFLLSKLVRESGIKVVLSGEGSDELFGGYDIYRELMMLLRWSENPESSVWPEKLNEMYGYLPQFRGPNLKFLAAFYKALLPKIGLQFGGHQSRWSGNIWAAQLIDSGNSTPSMGEAITALSEKIESMDSFSQTRMVELRTLLHGYLLSTQGDRMASAHSIELRLPFLDTNLAAFAMAKGMDELLPNFREKALLHDSFSDLLPTEVKERRKVPYLAPDAEFLFSKPLATQGWRDYVTENSLREVGFLNVSSAKRLLEKVEKLVGDQTISRRENTAFFTLLSASVLQKEFVGMLRPKSIGKKIRKSIHLEMVGGPA